MDCILVIDVQNGFLSDETRYVVPRIINLLDNFDASNVNKVSEIPMDYDGIIGVPITFMDKYNPEQFEIVGCTYNYGIPKGWSKDTNMQPIVNGKHIYKRILIRKKVGANNGQD